MGGFEGQRGGVDGGVGGGPLCRTRKTPLPQCLADPSKVFSASLPH